MKIVKLDMEHVQKGTFTYDLPLYFKGSEKQCRGMMLRFEWKKDTNINGGYWVDDDGNCYYLLP